MKTAPLCLPQIQSEKGHRCTSRVCSEQVRFKHRTKRGCYTAIICVDFHTHRGAKQMIREIAHYSVKRLQQANKYENLKGLSKGFKILYQQSDCKIGKDSETRQQ